MAGAFQASGTHVFTPLLSGGKSLHPLQRNGSVSPNVGLPVQPAAAVPEFPNTGNPPAMNLTLPPALTTSIIAATRGGNSHV